MNVNNSAPLRIAVIGAGYWGKNLVRNFHALGSLHTICDSHLSTRDNFAEQYTNIKIVEDIAEVLDNNKIDAVAIATPAETHFEIAMKCLLAGKHVFVEKPLALSAGDGQSLIKTAKGKRLVLMVGHLLNYHPAVVKLRDMVNSGELGRLQYIYSNRLNLGKIRVVENILWSFAPHDISVLLSLAGELPATVSCFGSHFLNKHIADVTVSNFTFPSGISAHIFVSWLHPFKEQKLVLVGDQKMAVFNDMEKEDKLLLYPHKVNWQNGVPVPDKKSAETVTIEKYEPLAEECRAFIDSIKNETTPITDGTEGLNVLNILNRCQESMENGGAVLPVDSREMSKGVKVHSTAVVDDDCQMGEGCKIWHFSHILKGSNLGENCNIGQNVVVGPNVTIGRNCKIQNNVSVYEGVTLGDDVFCGPSMVFTNVINPRSEIRRMDELKKTMVENGVTIGANATIICGIRLGCYSFIGAGAVVTKDVPDYALMVGNPAVQKGWFCKCGVKLVIENNHALCQACTAEYVVTGEQLQANNIYDADTSR